MVKPPKIAVKAFWRSNPERGGYGSNAFGGQIQRHCEVFRVLEAYNLVNSELKSREPKNSASTEKNFRFYCGTESFIDKLLFMKHNVAQSSAKL
jgi:hypothetical protein